MYCSIRHCLTEACTNKNQSGFSLFTFTLFEIVAKYINNIYSADCSAIHTQRKKTEKRAGALLDICMSVVEDASKDEIFNLTSLLLKTRFTGCLVVELYVD